MYCMIHIQDPIYYPKLKHVHIFNHIVAYLEPCVTLVYLEPCHIQNPGIFRTQDILRSLSRHILAYSERCVMLAYWEPCHIQNFVTFRISVYLGPETYSESAICKSRNRESGNGMRGMMGMREIRVRTRRIRVGMRGIKVGMQGIRVGMWGIRVVTWGIKVRMWGNQGGNAGNQGENAGI